MRSFYESSEKQKSNSAPIFPVQNPDLPEDSKLSNDSDEEFIASKPEEEVYTTETSDDSSDDSSDEQKQ